MRSTWRAFVALQPGERPGDPDLGGWRPLPLGRCVEADSGRQVAQRSAHQWAGSIASLNEAVRLVASRARTFNLREALNAVAARLVAREGSMMP